MQGECRQGACAQGTESGWLRNVITEIERRLRAALADTTAAPASPMSSLELPFKMDKLLTPALMRNLRPAAVLVPVVRRKQEPTVLLTRRADHLRAHKGQISFPGGRRDESDASAAATAVLDSLPLGPAPRVGRGLIRGRGSTVEEARGVRGLPRG